jgi:hypothetical protein
VGSSSCLLLHHQQQESKVRRQQRAVVASSTCGLDCSDYLCNMLHARHTSGMRTHRTVNGYQLCLSVRYSVRTCQYGGGIMDRKLSSGMALHTCLCITAQSVGSSVCMHVQLISVQPAAVTSMRVP